MLVAAGLVGGIAAISIVSLGALWGAQTPALGLAGISAIVVLASIVLQFAVAMVSADYRRRAAEARLRSLEERGERQLRDAMRGEALRSLEAR